MTLFKQFLASALSCALIFLTAGAGQWPIKRPRALRSPRGNRRK